MDILLTHGNHGNNLKKKLKFKVLSEKIFLLVFIDTKKQQK